MDVSFKAVAGKTIMQELKIEYIRPGSYNRQLFSLALPNLEMPPTDIKLPGPHFVCLLCCNARGITDKTILSAANMLLRNGLVYLCAWGPDCERVRQLFETAALVWNSGMVVLTTHLDDSLDEAVVYFRDIAHPALAYEQTCRTGLAISVADHEWAVQIQQRLACPSENPDPT
jgi:hypothetical protein